MSSKPVIYCIPGLAADKTIFRSIRVEGYEMRYLEWVDPLKGEDITAYAKRFCRLIDASQAFILMGCSLGGIMAVEMSRHCRPERLILLSSNRGPEEFPWYLKVFKYLPLYWVIPFPLFKGAIKVYRMVAGSKGSKAELKMIDEMLAKTTPKFFKWAIHEILNWKGNPDLPPVTHLHGTNDKLLPIRFVKDPIRVENGNHLMVIGKAKEINGILARELGN
jgi:hypothetical protein